MDQCEEDYIILQVSVDQELEEQPPPPPSTECVEQPAADQEAVSEGEEYDTDLEADDMDKNARLSRAEVYRRACQETGAVPISVFLHNLNETHLNLNHYSIGPVGVKALAMALQDDFVVTRLELEDNALGVEGTRHLMKMLRSNGSIESLNLAHNQLGSEGARVVSKMLLENYLVKSIKLAGNDLDDTAAKHLTEALKGDYVVKELDLSHNRLFDHAGAFLGEMLASNVGIEDLNLSWNHISYGGAVAFASGLKFNSTLRQLRLMWNGMGRVGAEALGAVLKQNSTLELLDLTQNLLDNQAVALLCQGLACNHTLKVLKLSHNSLTSTGALMLLKTVVNNPRSAIEELDISTVFVCEAFEELLEEAHQKKPALVVHYSIMSSVTRNISAFRVFEKFLKENDGSVVDFFAALDKEGTMEVSTDDFRKAVQEAKVPLDHKQVEWLIQKFDENCTATIKYSQFTK